MDSILALDFQGMLVVAAGITACYSVYIVIWRLYFTPVSKFPGPKLTATTWWYEFYFDVFLVAASPQFPNFKLAHQMLYSMANSTKRSTACMTFTVASRLAFRPLCRHS